MAQQAAARHHFTLNTDGRPHPLPNTLTAVAVVLAVLGGVCMFFGSLHIIASWAGLLGVGAGMWAQLISATTAERCVNVCTMVVSGLAILFGLAHGGLY